MTPVRLRAHNATTPRRAAQDPPLTPDPTPRPPSRPAPRWALCALVAASAWLAAATAAAQGGPASQEEDHNFWEEVIDPAGPAYRKLQDRARLAWSLGAWGALEKAVGKMEALKPDAPDTRYFKALLLAWEGDHAKAAELLQGVIDGGRFGDVPAESVYLDLALVRTRRGDLGEALEAYSAALRAGRDAALTSGQPTQPNRAMTLANMAELHMAEGRLKESIDLYQRALAVSPGYRHAQFGLGVALERQGDHEQATGYLLQVALGESRQERFFSEGTFFMPAEEEHFYRALLAEQRGRVEEARRHLERFIAAAKASGNPWTAQGERALARLDRAGPLELGEGPLPMRRITAAAADPKGRFIALGDTFGRVALVRLKPLEVVKAPLLSGPEVIGLTFDSEGRLMVARKDGYLRVVRGDGRLGELIGPIALPSGGALMGLSHGAEAVLVSSGRNQRWGVAEVKNVGVELGQLELPFSPSLMAIGPWDEARRQLTAVFWTERRELALLRWPQAGKPTFLRPPGARLYRAIGLTPTGSHTILAGSAHVLVVRTSDFRVQRMVQVGADVQANQETPVGVVVDVAGGGGWGPALIVLYPGRFRALRLEGVIPTRSG